MDGVHIEKVDCQDCRWMMRMDNIINNSYKENFEPFFIKTKWNLHWYILTLNYYNHLC